MSLEQDIRSLVAPALPATTVLDGVTVTPAGKRRVVRITVDRALDAPTGSDPVQPLTLDEIADATRAVSGVLDSSDVLGQAPYVLEVTTPGVDRPLTEPEHFRRNVGRLVTFTLAEVPELTARVAAVDADGVDAVVPATKKTPERAERLTFADIARGRVQVEFNRPTAEPTTAGEPAQERN